MKHRIFSFKCISHNTAKRFSYAIIATLLILGTYINPVYAETVNCRAITSAPYTISAPGVYCLKNNINFGSGAGNAITINSDDVTIDLNSYLLRNSAGRGTNANGIYSQDRKNILIKNGTIRGFVIGIKLMGTDFKKSRGHIIENIQTDKSRLSGFRLQGHSITVRNNQVINTGNSTIYSGATGIAVIGSGADISNNIISKVRAPGSSTNLGLAQGLVITNGHGTVASNNHITQVSAKGIAVAGGSSYGIRVWSSRGIELKDNYVSHLQTVGINIHNGSDAIIRRSSLAYIKGTGILFSPGSRGKYMNNLTTAVTTPFLGGISVGINN